LQQDIKKGNNMPYIGKQPAQVPIDVGDIPNNSISAAKIIDGAITAADIGADAVGLSELSATGTASATTFLRGDNSWAVAGITQFPFFKANGSADNIAITNGQFPFFKADGSADNIGVT
jgi:hypothetical protein